jgi:hypothetical protein
MKKVIPLIMMIVLFAFGASAQTVWTVDVNLAWDPNPEPDIAGYKLYYGTVSGEYAEPVDVGNVITGNVPGLQLGTLYFFAATAYNTSGLESDFSDEISWTTPSLPGPPQTLQINGATRSPVPPPSQ